MPRKETLSLYTGKVALVDMKSERCHISVFSAIRLRGSEGIYPVWRSQEKETRVKC